MPLSRVDKEFVLLWINQIDAKFIQVDRAFGNLLLLIKSDGRPVKKTKKLPILISNLAETIAVDREHFAGFEGERVGLLARWLESDFADVVRTGRARKGEAVLAGFRPLHLDVVKLRHPAHAKDFGASRFLYSVIRQSPALLEALKDFFGIGSRDDHYDGSADLDVETLFLLRLLDRYEFDRHSLARDEYYEPLCAGETTIFINDLQRIMLYRRYIPRRELIRYLLTLASFHLALSMLKTFRVVNGIIETGRGCKGYCHCDPNGVDPTPNCPYRPDIFVDLSEQKDLCYVLAQVRVKKHYAEVGRYIKNHIRLKKLEEFGEWLKNRGHSSEVPRTIMGLLDLEGHPKVDTFFEGRIENLLTPETGEDRDARLETIAQLGMDALDTYVEMLYALRHNYHLAFYRKMLDSFCGKNLDSGFVSAGRGRIRRYYLGTELLETLVQVAVVDIHPKRGFYTRGITIAEFVAWLKHRYGLLIDEYGESVEGVEITQAMRQNYEALKFRLRQLGFYTDVSDASNSQLIQPRFEVKGSRA